MKNTQNDDSLTFKHTILIIFSKKIIQRRIPYRKSLHAVSEPLAVRCAGLKREVNQNKLFLLIKMFKIFLKTILTHVFKIKKVMTRGDKKGDTGRQKRRHGASGGYSCLLSGLHVFLFLFGSSHFSFFFSWVIQQKVESLTGHNRKIIILMKK